MRAIDDPKQIIIDVRDVNAYNGWRLMGEKRGGHIRSARSLSSKWASYIDWIEIVRNKGINTESKLILYGYELKETIKVADMFRSAGYPDIRIYEDFLDEWVSDPGLPMDYLPEYKRLVHPAWLKNLLEGESPPHYQNDHFVLCHAHYRNPDIYHKGHIPGAISLDTLLLESASTWNRRSPGELEKNLSKLGITSDTTVILYGRFDFPKNEDPFPGSSAGHLGAIRSAAIMIYAGVKDVRVLNGGLQSWLDAGYDITTRETLPKAASEFGAKIPQRPEFMIDTPQAKQLIASEQANLVCVRSWPEYIGEVSGYNYIEKKGRIPGAVFADCGTDAYHMENYRNLDHTTREYHEIAANWEKDGINADKQNAFYCGTGWRGSEAFFNAFLLGWPNIAVYDGGWFEWSNDPENPVETGIPE